MNNFLHRTPQALPRLKVAQHVIDKMVHNALIYQTETGESLVGFAIPTKERAEPDLYVIDTIPPDESAIRQGAYFEQGDDVQGDIFNWWFDNWNQYRRQNQKPPDWNSRWDVPLTHLGDWHKHPGTLTEPSWGDASTAREVIASSEAESPQLLAILATVWDRQRAQTTEPIDPEAIMKVQAQPLKIPVDDLTVVRLDCWYMSKQTRHFTQLSPLIADYLPKLPVIAWHLREPDRAQQEIAALQQYGYSVSLEQYDTDGAIPLEICLMLAKRTSQNALIVVTQADYPASRPSLYSIPMAALRDIPQGADIFVEAWKKAKPVSESLYSTWKPARPLAEFVSQVEATLEKS